MPSSPSPSAPSGGPGPHAVAVTVIGTDRPGIVAEVTGALARVEANLEDSTMTLLRGQFAMVVLVRTPVDVEAVRRSLEVLGADGSLGVDVRALADRSGAPAVLGGRYVLHVNGADRPGIVAAITAVLAGHGANLVDLGTRLAGELYVLTAEVLLPEGADVDTLLAGLDEAARTVGVNVRLMPVETDEM